MINDSFGQTLLVIVATALTLWLLHQLLLGVYQQSQPKPTDRKARQRKPVEAEIVNDNADDLTRIEGVGPKIAGLLNDAGYFTFAEVRDAKISDLRKVLKNAGPRYRTHDAGTWPRQARLAASGEWKKLDKLQARLRGGRS